MRNLELTGLNIEQLPIEKGISLFDLSILMWETTTGLAGILEYNTDLFDQRTIEQFIQNFQTLLQELVANPNQSILSIPMLTKDQQYWSQYRNKFKNSPRINPRRQFSPVIKSAPQDELERQLIQIWQKVLGISSVCVEDNFLNLGGHSLLALRLFAEIENTLGKRLPLATLFQVPTIKELAQVIRQTGTPESSFSLNSPKFNPEDYRKLLATTAGRQGKKPRPESLIVSLNHQGNKQPFFFCGSSLDEVLPLMKYLGDEQPIHFMESGFSVFLPKVTEENIQALAAHHVQDILTLQPEGDYMLAGYSLGCLVTYEIVKQLERQGKKVSLLVMLDFTGYNPILHQYFAKVYPVFYKIGAFVNQCYKNLIQRHKNQSSLPMNECLPLYLMQGYSGKVHLFLVSELSLHHKLLRLFFPRFGWKKETVEQVYKLPGNHLTFLAEPHVQVLADRLTVLLRTITVPKKKDFTVSAR
jgi:thioesterase domain-containing protein/acyl carrier protein